MLQSLWSFVSLDENYLDEVISHYDDGIIPNAYKILSENWAIALHHEWSGDFCLRMYQGFLALEDLQNALNKTSKERIGISLEMINQFNRILEP